MNWKKLKEKIYFEDGSLRDIYIHDFNKEEWLQWIDYVNSNYRLQWFNTEKDVSEDKIDPDVITGFFDGSHDLCQTTSIFIKDVCINAHFFSEEEFENDIDPREFNSIEDHNLLMKYLIELSKMFNKEVLLTVENYDPNNPKEIILKVNGDTTTYLQ